MSISAAGTLAGSLTYLTSNGVQIVKKIPEPNNRASRDKKAASARHKFLANAWSNFLKPIDLTSDWQPLADQRQITRYNAYLSYNLVRANQSSGPRLSPTTDYGSNAGDATTIVRRPFPGGVAFSVSVGDQEDTWGVWFNLLINPLEGWRTQNIVTSLEVPLFGLLDVETPAVRGLKHGSLWYPAWRTFSYDGTLGPQHISIMPITIP